MVTYTGQRVGYLRVSSADQNLTRQQIAVGGCDKTFTDKASGKSREGRSQLEAMLSHIREGDLVVVASMDRLARSLLDLEQLVAEITGKGVKLHFLKEDLVFSSDDDPYSRFQMQLIGAVAELERSLIRERQREGIEAAKKRGVYKGRVRSLSPAEVESAKSRVAQGVPKTQVARELGISRTTLYRYLKQGPTYAQPDQGKH